MSTGAITKMRLSFAFALLIFSCQTVAGCQSDKLLVNITLDQQRKLALYIERLHSAARNDDVEAVQLLLGYCNPVAYIADFSKLDKLDSIVNVW